MDTSLIVRKMEKVISRKIGDDYVLVPVNRKVMHSDSLYAMNGVGGLIWELIDGKRTLGQISEKVVETAPAPVEQVKIDVAHYVADLLSEELVEPCGP